MESSLNLGEVPLFKGLSSEQLKLLERAAVSRQISKGETLFSQDETAEGFYVVLSGKIKVFKLSPQGKSQILGVFGPGDTVGEVPVFEGGTYPAYAQAMERASVAFFPRDRFIGLIRENPDLALGMMAVLSRRLRRLASLAESLALKEVPSRLAQYLLSLLPPKGGEVMLSVKKGELAEMLGTTPETISRAFSRLSSQGIMEVKGARIHVLNKQALEKIAEGI